VTAQRLAELADFYGVPVSELLPDSSPAAAAEPPPRLVIDLEQLNQVPAEKAGPLARYANNYDELSDVAKEAAEEAGLGRVCRNPFRSIVVRGVETLYAADEALRIIESYEPPSPPAVECAPRAASGCGCTEAPRGICWHRYELDATGVILDANIVPPTSQNQKTIEEDLTGVVGSSLDLPDDRLAHVCEQTIRNYDPCISCSAHFLHPQVDRLREFPP